MWQAIDKAEAHCPSWRSIRVRVVLAVIALLVVVAMTASRLVVAVYYPSDVLAALARRRWCTR